MDVVNVTLERPVDVGVMVIFELVRFLDSHEGDGARAVFTGVWLLYRNNTPHHNPSKFAHH